MFLKAIVKTDKHTSKRYVYYRLCESYRIGTKTRHRTILSLGLLEELPLAQERKQLADAIEHLLRGDQKTLFGLSLPEHVEKLARKFYLQIKQLQAKASPLTGNVIDDNTYPPTFERVDLDSLTTEDVREIGAEWLCKQTLEELGIGTFLTDLGWSKEAVDLALIHITSRAVYPASENKTAKWIGINSGVAELFGKSPDKISRFQLYKASSSLYRVKADIEPYLSTKTNTLFDIQDKIYLYDLTNTYFEGRKQSSKIAQFGRSKEKRSDCKLVAIALVTNAEGFVKYSKIYQGNISDCETLEEIVAELSSNTSETQRKPLVVIDAGIATEDNLPMLKNKGYDYMCVSRSRMKDYTVTVENTIKLYDQRGSLIEVQRVVKPGNSDQFLYVRSEKKALKEASMKAHFSIRYEEELNNVAKSLLKKRGIKKSGTIHERLGRIKERYPSANKHYQIEVIENDGIVTEIKWSRKELQPKSREGVYFLRTSLQQTDEKTMWNIYNTLKEIESAFRTLKTDLSLRPIFHQKDEYSSAHLFLGILAYSVVATIRYKLKAKGINHDWKNIVRIMNTQKVSTVTIKNDKGDIINIRTCSIPIQEAKQIYSASNYKPMPFYRKKFVFPEK